MKWLSLIGSKAKFYGYAALAVIAGFFYVMYQIGKARLESAREKLKASERSNEALKKANETSAKIREAKKQAQELAAKRERETKPTTSRPTGNFGDDRLK